MAITVNKKAGSPIKVTGTATSSEKVFSEATYVKFVKWHKPTTSGHKLNIINESGETLAKFECETGNKSQWAPIWGRWSTCYIDDMDSGEVYIYGT